MSASIVQGPPGAFANLTAAALTLALRIVGLFFAILSWIFFVFSISPYIAISLAFSLLMIPWVNYHDQILENIEFGMRCRVEPFYRTWPRNLLILIRILYDPLVCWYDIIVWFPFGVTQEVIIPLAIEGGLLDAFTALGNFLGIFIYDFVIRYYASLDILSQPFDFQRTCDAWVAFWQQWQNVICYLCQDLCVFFRLQPVIIWVPGLAIPPMFNPLFFLGSNQAGDPKFCAAIFNAFNGFMRIVQPLFQIVVSILIGQVPKRPDFRSATDFFCEAISCFVRSSENAAQFFVDEFLPFPFVFINLFCTIDTTFCLVFKAIDNMIRLLVNIDQVVFYPGNDFLLRVVKRDLVEWLNLMAPLNYVAPNPNDLVNGVPYAFLWPKTAPSVTTPNGTIIVNPQFGKDTLADCVRLFFERLLCDPTNSDTACFDPGAQDVLGIFDPGCVFFEFVVLAADVAASIAEIFYHLYDPGEFFVYVDRQFSTTIVKDDLVRTVKCIFDVFTLIPVVGDCLSRLFTGLVEAVLCFFDFAIRFVACLIFLIYYLLTGTPSFITEKGRAQVFVRNFLDILSDVDNPNSVVNCICFMLNFGLQLPPIPCNDCIPSGFIDPMTMPITRRDDVTGDLIETTRREVPYVSQRELDKTSQQARRKRFVRDDDNTRETTLAGHQPHVRSVLEQLRTTHSDTGKTSGPDQHQSPFYESIIHNSKHFGEHVNVNDMKHFFKTRRQRFEHKLRTYLEPWRKEQVEARIQQYWQEQDTSPNPGHPTHSATPFIDALWERAKARAGKVYTPTETLPNNINDNAAGQEHEPRYFSVRDDMEASEEFGPHAKEHPKHKLGSFDVRDQPPMDMRNQPPMDMRDQPPTSDSLAPREVISPTVPPIVGCTPIPPCFDTCDIFRSFLIFVDDFITLVTNIVFALLQDWDISFPYFITGEVSICSELCPTVDKNAPDCQVPCPGINISLEEDLRQAIVALANMLRAICNILNLVIPVELTINNVEIITERPDICCSVVRLGDLVACILLVIIKGIKSLALEGGQGFPYFTQGLFLMDVDLLFDLTFDVVVCLCNLVRAVFPVQNVADLDVCCIVENGAMFILELLQWAFQIVISLGTIQTSGQPYFVDQACGWTDSNCDPNVNEIGFVIQADIVGNSLFGALGGACSNSLVSEDTCNLDARGKGYGEGGVIVCVCQLVSTIFPVRPDPGRPTAEDNCLIIDLCCVLRRAGFALNSLWKFAIRLLATLWQRWDGNPPLPTGFIAFWFCDEETAPPGSPCGEFNIIIENLVAIVDDCLCQIFSLIDAFFQNVWPSFSCFCGLNDGIFCGAAGVVKVIIVQVVELLRRLNDPTYWQVRTGGFNFATGGVAVPYTFNETWAFRFFDPISKEFCKLASSLSCFIQILIPKCTVSRANIFNAAVVWVFEAIIRIYQFIEGFVLSFAGRGCSGSSDLGNGYGFNTECLTGVLVSLLSFPVDALIADAGVVCIQDPCGCYEGLAPNYVVSDANYAQITNNRCVIEFQQDNIPDSENGYTDCRSTLQIIGGTPYPQCLPRCLEGPFGNPAGDRCVDIVLPKCATRLGRLVPIDGIIMALLKYFRCILAVIFPFFADVNIADALILAFSIIWQLSRAIINFIAASIVFFFTLFSIAGGGCACHNGGLAIQRAGAFCYACTDPDTGDQAVPGVSDVLVYDDDTAGGLFTRNYCCRKSTFNSAQGIDGCEQVPHVGYIRPLTICSIFNFGTAFFDLLDSFIGIFKAFTRIVTPIPNTNTLKKRDADDMTGSPSDWNTQNQASSRAAYYATFADRFSRRDTSTSDQAPTNEAWYHVLRSRYNTTDPIRQRRHAFQRWLPGTRDPHSRSRSHFKARAEHVQQRYSADYVYANMYAHGNAPEEAQGNALDIVMDAVFGFDTDDCMDNPIACICRNMEVPGVCTWDVIHDEPKSNHTLTTREVMLAMTHVFDNHTVCDAVIRDVAELTWIDVPFAIRAEYMECMELRIQGERIRDIYPGFPANMFYSPKDGIPQLIHSMYHDSQYMYTTELDMRMKQEQDYHETYVRNTPFEDMQRQISARRAQRLARMRRQDMHPGEMDAALFMARMDEFFYKFSSGYYHHHVGNMYARAQNNEFVEHESLIKRTHVVAKHAYTSGTLAVHAMSRIPELMAVTWHAGVATTNVLQDMYTRGVTTVMGEGWERYKTAITNDHGVAPPDAARLAKRQFLRDTVTQSPLYKWLFDPSENTRRSPLETTILSPFARFKTHVYAVMDHQRNRATPQYNADGQLIRAAERNVFNLWGAQDQWEKVKADFWKRWEPRPLTAKQRENRHRGWRVIHKIRYLWDPSTVSREVYERFIFGCDCAVVDQTLALLVDVVTYCANNFVPNIPMLERLAHDQHYRQRILGGRWNDPVQNIANYTIEPGPLSRFVERITPMVNDVKARDGDTFHHARHRLRTTTPTKSNRATYRYEAWPIPASDDAFYYIRPRLVYENRTRPLHRDLSRIDVQQWRRNQNEGGARNFNLLQWFVCLIDSIFGTQFANDLDQFFMDLEDWFNNPSTDPADFPHVGFKYWATFWLRCEFPENLDCSIGIGLEKALEKTLWWFLIIFVLGALLLPSILIPLTFFGLFLTFIIVVPALAWHYSPRCWLMTPSIIQGPISVPLWPFPIAPAALPFCALADFNALLDKWITTCYDFVFPDYVVVGNVCPPCDQMIDIINCRDVKVSDGLQHLIYLGNRWFGDSFCENFRCASQTVFFSWFGGFSDYTDETCRFIQDPDMTRSCQQRWCFWLTFPAIFLPIAIGVVIVTAIGFIIPAIFDIIVAFAYFLAATPLIVVMPGGGSQYFYHPGDDRLPDQYIESEIDALRRSAWQQVPVHNMYRSSRPQRRYGYEYGYARPSAPPRL